METRGHILVIDDELGIRIGCERYSASFGSGLARLAGKVFRIGHLGDLNEGMCLTALSLAEVSLAEAGCEIDLGSGVAAAQAFYTRRAQNGAARRERPVRELRIAAA